MKKIMVILIIWFFAELQLYSEYNTMNYDFINSAKGNTLMFNSMFKPEEYMNNKDSSNINQLLKKIEEGKESMSSEEMHDKFFSMKRMYDIIEEGRLLLIMV